LSLFFIDYITYNEFYDTFLLYGNGKSYTWHCTVTCLLCMIKDWIFEISKNKLMNMNTNIVLMIFITCIASPHFITNSDKINVS
jgi:hypothetical protein